MSLDAIAVVSLFCSSWLQSMDGVCESWKVVVERCGRIQKGEMGIAGRLPWWFLLRRQKEAEW